MPPHVRRPAAPLVTSDCRDNHLHRLSRRIDSFSLSFESFPTGLAPVTGSSQGLLTQIGQAVSEPLPGSPSTYTENWSFGIQRELPGKILIDSTYVGNHGGQLISAAEATINLNQLTPDQVAQGSSLLNQVPNPFF